MSLRRSVVALTSLGLALAMFFMGGCASDSGGSAEPQPTGTVTVLFTDAPTDDFSAINVTVSRIDLLPLDDDDSDSDDLSDNNDGDSDSDSDSTPVTLFSSTSTFDLLALENFTSLFSITPDVPAGQYNKLRLTLTDLELIERDTGNAVNLEVPGRIDLLAREPFTVEPDTNLLVTIDIDARRSIHINGDDGELRFRPVVFVTVSNAPGDPGSGDPGDPGSGDPGDPGSGDPGSGDPGTNEKFIRVQGFMNRSDLANGTFGMQVPNAGGQQFDLTLAPGAPVFLSQGNLATQNFEILDNVATAVGKFDPNNPLLFEAVIINVGFGQNFFYGTAGGTAASTASNGEFTFTPDGAADVTVTTVPETQVFTGAGDPESLASIAVGSPLEIDGLTMPTGTLATLVVLVQEARPLELLAGQIASVSTTSLTVATPTGDRCVHIDTADISISMSAPDGSVTFGPGTAADLMAGDTVDVYGIEAADGCMRARTVIAFTSGV